MNSWNMEGKSLLESSSQWLADQFKENLTGNWISDVDPQEILKRIENEEDNLITEESVDTENSLKERSESESESEAEIRK